MFYYPFLLSRKGPLGIIWLAAHCHRRLNKDQVKQTDISSSVDKILQDAVPEVTYRILAYLLLGVVRVFSKKVDFLFSDCCKARDNLDHLAGIKVEGKSSKAKCLPTYSISLPKRFELDAFDLEVPGDQDISCFHVMAREEIMLADTLKEGIGCSNRKFNYDQDLSFGPYSAIGTSVRDVFSPHPMDIDLDLTMSRFMSNLGSGMEKFPGINFSLDDHLESMIFGEAGKDSGFGMPSAAGNESDGEEIRNPDVGEAAELSKLRDEKEVRIHESEKESVTIVGSVEGHEFNGDQMTDCDTGKPTEMVDLVDKEQSKEKLLKATSNQGENQVSQECTFSSPSNPKGQNAEEQIKYSGAGISLKEPEILRSLDRESNAESGEMKLPEMSPLPNKMSVKHPISVTIDKSPDSKSQGAVSSDLMAVRTPSVKERARVIKKRKCLVDETVVISNNVYKQWIGNSSVLVSKRRKAPHTAFHSWQADMLSMLPESLVEPLIPWNSVALKSSVSQKNFTTQEPVEPMEVHMTEIMTQTLLSPVSPVNEKSREQTPIAPTTPVTKPTSLRGHEFRGISKHNTRECASSSERTGSELAPNEDSDLFTSLMNEELNSSAGDGHGKQKCSVRSRKVAEYLHAKLLHLRKQEGEVYVSLMQVLRGKTRSKSAQFFYEILVLKTGDDIDVRQEHNFGDILILESSKLRRSL